MSNLREDLLAVELESKKAELQISKSKLVMSRFKRAIFVGAIGVGLGLFVSSLFIPEKKQQPFAFYDMSAKYSEMGYAKSFESSKRMFVIDYKGPFTVDSAESFAKQVDFLAPKIVKGDIVVLSIMSNGGAVISCGHSFDQVRRLQNYGATVIATIDYAALSCGYQLASAANQIVAASSAMVGNIGAVFAYKPGFLDVAVDYLNKDKKGFVAGSSRTKELLAGDNPKNEEEVQIFRDKAKRSWVDFYSRVLELRSKSIKEQDREKAFSGDSFSGKEAREIGLVDLIMDERTFFTMSHKNGVNIYRIVSTRKPGLVENIIK